MPPDRSYTRCFVTAIGTDSGKTLVSAILCRALSASYWKPIQTGSVHDTQTLLAWSQGQIHTYPSAYVFSQPASPHISAAAEHQDISLDRLHVPGAARALVVEGAGGILVPINPKETMLDLMQHLNLPVVLVVNLYLGCINHTLLSARVLTQTLGPQALVGMVFNGEENQPVQQTLLDKTGLPQLLHVKPEKHLDLRVIDRYASQVQWPRQFAGGDV